MQPRPLLLLALLLLVTAAPWQPALAQRGGEWACVTVDGVNLRRGPGTDQPVISSLWRGETFWILERRQGWYGVVPTSLYVAANRIDQDGRVAPGGADLLLSETAASPVVTRVRGGSQLQIRVQRGGFVAVAAPPSLRLWISSSYLTPGGVPMRSSDFVSRGDVPIPDAEFQRLAAQRANVLRFVVLPTRIPNGYWAKARADGGRFGPSYSVKYTRGSSWFTISAGTGGLGGPGVADRVLTVDTPVLGRVVVGTARDQVDPFTEGTALLGGSTLGGKVHPLTIFFSCSPDLDLGVTRSVLVSLRAVRL